MSRKQLFACTVLAGLMLAAPLRAQETTVPDAPAAVGNQPAAPIIHRRTSLPAGWFKQGQASGALTDTRVIEARPAAHFDTTGESSNGGQGAAQRLRRMRESVILDTPPAPPGAPAAEGTESSRRQAEIPVGAAPANPSLLETQIPSNGAPPAAAPALPSGAGVPGVTAPNGPPAAGATTPGSAVPSPVAGSVSPNANPSVPEATAPESSTGVPPTGDLPGVDQLPSVMKRPASSDASAAPSSTSGAADLPTQPITEPMQLFAGEAATAPVADMNMNVHAAPGESGATEASIDQGAEPPSASETTANVLIENESPILSVVTRGPKTIVVGKPAHYVVEVTNRSDVAAKDVVVRMNIPQWVEILEQTTTSGAANIRPDDSGNAVLAWRVDRLNGQAQERLMLELVPRGNRPLDLGVTWTFSPAQSVTQIQVQEPKLQLSVVGPQDVMYGETKVYTITVANPGTGDAENVVLHLLPLVPGDKVAGVRRLGTVPAGSRQTMEVELTARQTGRLEVRAEVTADGGLTARGQQDVLVRRASLEVQVEGPPMKYAGTRARYVVRVTNAGDAAASEVVVSANLPAGAKEVAASDGGSFDPHAGQIQWHLGSLRPGASRVYQFECTLMSPGDNRVDLRSVAAGDLSALGSTVTQVESLADLKLMVNDPQGAVAIGADVVYEVKITNRGTKAAEDIQVFGYFSEGVEPVSVSGWKGQVNEGEVVLQRIPRLGAGQEMVLRITAQANRPGDHVFRAELECNDPETKLAIEEWTRFYGEPAIERQAERAENGRSAAGEAHRAASSPTFPGTR